MVAAGHSPSVRLFEAAACGVPIVTDRWNGLDAFFRVGEEILVAEQPGDVLAALALPEERRRAIAAAARKRVLHAHTAAHRAQALESYVAEVHAAAPRKPEVAVA
jgi:spore maturation protein CgeB